MHKLGKDGLSGVFLPGQLWSYEILPSDTGGPVHMWSHPQGGGTILSELKTGDIILVLSVRLPRAPVSSSGMALSVEALVGSLRGWLWLVRDNIVTRRFKLITSL